MFQADDELIVRFAARRNLLTNQESVSDTLFAACVIDAKDAREFSPRDIRAI
jgi:hypothetical protein